jgi:sigma-B regulation protein RsbU (phosphoserine phosphatase)
MANDNQNDERSGAESREEINAAAIRKSLDSLDLAGSLGSPIRQAIDDILKIAKETVGSADASVLVRDGQDGGLRFLVAVSELEEQLLKIRIPPGKGIAGSVFSSGQPMAVNDTSSEGSFWSGADEKVGFKTITLLATPLRFGNETIGVLEFVNRPGEPPYPPFTPEEMDDAARFADPIARLVDAYELAQLVESLFNQTLKTSSEESSGKELATWLKNVDAAPEHRDLLTLALSLRDIVSRGDAEREMCRDLLEVLARFAEKRSATGSSYFNF